MASPIFLHHVVGDLTLGKPDLVEFHDTETLEAAVRAIREQSEGAIAVWKKQPANLPRDGGENSRTGRFVGMLNSLDVVAFMARVGDPGIALQTPVSEIVVPNDSLLKEVDPGTRLIDVLEMMKQGVRRLVVRKTATWRVMSKRFSIVFNPRWTKISESVQLNPSSSSSSSSSFCSLSREDVLRFLISCLGALAPLPLTSVSEVNAVSSDYAQIDASSPAIEVYAKGPHDACAVVETGSDGRRRIIGEISAFKLWRCDLVAASWAMARFSAGQFVSGFEDGSLGAPSGEFSPTSEEAIFGGSARLRKFSSRSIGFVGKELTLGMGSGGVGMYRGRSSPLTCRRGSSLAAVMAQMLSHRASQVWVMEEGGGGEGGGGTADDVLVGVVGYVDIFYAVTGSPTVGASCV